MYLLHPDTITCYPWEDDPDQHEEETDFDVAIETYPIDWRNLPTGITEEEIRDTIERDYWQYTYEHWRQSGVAADPIDAAARDIEWAAGVIWQTVTDRHEAHGS